MDIRKIIVVSVSVLSLCLGLTACSTEKPVTDVYSIEYEQSDVTKAPMSTSKPTPVPTATPMPLPTTAPTPLPTATPELTLFPDDTVDTTSPDPDITGGFEYLYDGSDFGKVYWGVTYCPIEDLPGVTVSVTAFKDGFDYWNLIVGVTNMYDKPLSFSGDAAAKDDSGEYIGDTYAYLSNIGPGNTSVFKIYCPSGVPNGEIHWENLSIKEGFKTYVSWESDWALRNIDEDTLSVAYTIDMESNAVPGDIVGLILDDRGIVIDYFDDSEYEEGSSFTKEKVLYNSNTGDAPIRDVALFINPTTF